jgi:hypothetical protein
VIHWRLWQKVEAGDTNITIRALARIAAALDVDPRDLLASFLDLRSRLPSLRMQSGSRLGVMGSSAGPVLGGRRLVAGADHAC